MNRTVSDHLFFLNQRIQRLSLEIMQNRLTTEERNRIEAELRAAQQAAEYYRKALELERQFSSQS